MNYEIILYYKYAHIADPKKLMDEQKELCAKLGLKGRILIAEEGINGTLEGTPDNIKAYVADLKSKKEFADTHIKRSMGTGKAFPKLSIKVRKEIVSAHLNEKDVNPTQVTGKRLSPDELHEWFKNNKDFEIIDMRNDYEHKVGHFKNSILPEMRNFRDLPKIEEQLRGKKEKAILTVCTGGVRCEKASGYLVQQGWKDVYQLDGGIVSYMEKYPGQDFRGALYVFDNRITMHFNDPTKHEAIAVCDSCQTPSEAYINCKDPMCHLHFICCADCRDDQGEAFCNECKAKVKTSV